ncbi:hypothetical protein JOF28_000559 [Leucobacter exalbidus]|uniref:Uncharacterized protein n=1 Tax=Leucobacter exalbidus TaxID=662960 RepID=A0A940PK06_9MICO|nr:hypothetical protein [Leucobacter exalbidus]MBP1325327.1 hypothetical protein [Leucobacter exalbidus]
MLHAMIRPVEEFKTEVKGEGLEEIYERLEEARPEGFDLILAPVAMAKGETAITAVGSFAKRDGLRVIEADNMVALRALLPEGWQMLNVYKD